MEKEKILEGKEVDNLEDTSTSETTEIENEKVNLSNSPVPTKEEIEEANLSVEPNSIVDESLDDLKSDGPEIDEPVVVENVETETTTIGGEEKQISPTPEVHEENGVTEMPALKTFTQSQVNDMVGKTRMETREQTYKAIYGRYGVEDEAGMDELVGNAQRFESLQEKYKADKKNWDENSSLRDQELANLKEQVALMQSGIDNNRYEDAKFILKGKGLEVNIENIRNELATHPEWQGKSSGEEVNENFVKTEEAKIDTKPTEPTGSISVLGNEGGAKQFDEEDFVLSRMFKV